jgi:hypothetical protein
MFPECSLNVPWHSLTGGPGDSSRGIKEELEVNDWDSSGHGSDGSYTSEFGHDTVNLDEPKVNPLAPEGNPHDSWREQTDSWVRYQHSLSLLDGLLVGAQQKEREEAEARAKQAEISTLQTNKAIAEVRRLKQQVRGSAL